MDDDANTTDEEKDRYSTLVRELNQLDRNTTTGDKKQQLPRKSVNYDLMGKPSRGVLSFIDT